MPHRTTPRLLQRHPNRDAAQCPHPLPPTRYSPDHPAVRAAARRSAMPVDAYLALREATEDWTAPG